MADDGGGWDDLFAAAAGDASHAHDNVTPAGTKRPAANRQFSAESETNTSTPRSKKKAKKKARKNKPERHHQNGGTADHRVKMLESRMDVSQEATRHWPAWVRPGGSLLDGSSSSSSSSVSCQGYAGQYEASKDGDYAPKKKRKCSACGKSPLHHALVINSSVSADMSTDADDHLNIFLWNRNIRVCACLALASGANNSSSGLVGAYAKAALRYSNQINSRIHSLTSRLSSVGEGSILEEKFSALQRAVKAWRSGRDGAASSDFNFVVRVIIASDAFYFRLYYLQLTASLPIRDSGVHIPHPTTYFVADRLSWDTVAGSRCVRKLLKKDDCDGKIPEVVQQYLSLSSSSDHPLTVLKSSRFCETVLLFGDWSQDPQTKRDFARAVKAAASNTHLPSPGNLSAEDAFYDMHECPAPRILMDWRDVCRDHNCNLYAYATLGPNSIDDLKPVCSSVGVIEAGAGTGYYASLLQAAGIDVKPFDIASTDASINEYHGSTPAFTQVENGGIDKLKSDLHQFHKRSLRLPSLLLCYPPPLSEMAHDALRVFIGAGGKQLVHIGEFEGLTGSPAFEQLLVKEFKCVLRAPCLRWGTDASTISVWELSATAKSSKNAFEILMPCSHCKSKPSTHRFRLIRSLNYCSKDCYKAHASTRSAHALCNMIPLKTVEEASFDDEKYFSSLKSIDKR